MPTQAITVQDANIQRYVAELPLKQLKRLAVGHPDAMEAAMEAVIPKPLLSGRSGPLF